MPGDYYPWSNIELNSKCEWIWPPLGTSSPTTYPDEVKITKAVNGWNVCYTDHSILGLSVEVVVFTEFKDLVEWLATRYQIEGAHDTEKDSE